MNFQPFDIQQQALAKALRQSIDAQQHAHRTAISKIYLPEAAVAEYGKHTYITRTEAYRTTRRVIAPHPEPMATPRWHYCLLAGDGVDVLQA